MKEIQDMQETNITIRIISEKICFRDITNVFLKGEKDIIFGEWK
jgi:hypothetical protein